MRLTLTNIASNINASDVATTRNHRLLFVESTGDGANAPTPIMTGPGLGGGDSLTMTCTAAEAATYAIGEEYDIAIQPGV